MLYSKISNTTFSVIGSKVMILNGYPFENGQNVEIIDLIDQAFTCTKFPKTNQVRGGVAGVVDNTPIWCGGFDGTNKIKYCEKLDMEAKIWEQSVELKEATVSMGKGSIIVNGSLLISGGSKDKGKTDTIELVSLTASSEAEFKLPLPLLIHCNIQINDSTVMITGGVSEDILAETYYQNLFTGKFTKGPDMNEARFYHACTKFQLNGVNYAIVLGGADKTSIEFLNLDKNDSKWTTANSEYNFFEYLIAVFLKFYF